MYSASLYTAVSDPREKTNKQGQLLTVITESLNEKKKSTIHHNQQNSNSVLCCENCCNIVYNFLLSKDTQKKKLARYVSHGTKIPMEHITIAVHIAPSVTSLM